MRSHTLPTLHHSQQNIILNVLVQMTTLCIQTEAKDDEDKTTGERKRTRSRTYSVDVINNPVNEDVTVTVDGDEQIRGKLHPGIVIGYSPPKKPFGLRQSYLMIPASFCDMCGTCLMYVSLTLTSAGSFQMMRGLYNKE